MTRRVVVLERASLRAHVRRPNCTTEYIEAGVMISFLALPATAVILL